MRKPNIWNGISYLGLTDIWSRIILSWGLSCGLFSSSPDLYPLEIPAHSHPLSTAVITKTISGHCQSSPEEGNRSQLKSAEIKTHWNGPISFCKSLNTEKTAIHSHLPKGRRWDQQLSISFPPCPPWVWATWTEGWGLDSWQLPHNDM